MTRLQEISLPEPALETPPGAAPEATPSARPWAWWPALAAAGALHPLACTHGTLWPLALATVAVLVAFLAAPQRRAWHGALAGLVFGSAWLLSAVWWLFISMHRYGGLPAPLAAAAVLALSVALSAYLALACAAWVRWRGAGLWADALRFACLWLLAEGARGLLFTGFPWAASGYTQVDAPLARLAPWVGVYGMGFAVALGGALLGLGAAALAKPTPGYRRRALQSWAMAATVLAGPLLLPASDFTRATQRHRVALVQTHVAQDLKFEVGHQRESLRQLGEALQSTRAALVVAPETAVPLLPTQMDELAPGWWDAVQTALKASGRTALVGVPLGSQAEGYTNSAVAVGAQPGPAYRYDKHHLVPFGEFIPLGFRWFTEMMNVPLGDFTRGLLAAPSLAWQDQRLAPNICYEDLFGEELAARFADPARAPTALVNLSNIAWFGDSIAVQQHLNISRLRALELQRPMLRATNTGATAIVDHRGRVTHALKPFTRGVLEGEFEGREGLTPYARWASRLGLWPALALAVALSVALAWLGRGERSRRDDPRAAGGAAR